MKMTIDGWPAEWMKQLFKRGGYFDTTIMTAKCLACDKEFTKPLRWFYRRDGKCPACNGSIDKKPLLELDRRATEKLQEALRQLK